MDRLLADCRARLGFDLLANTWNAVVICALAPGPRRFRDLRASIGSISSKVLTETLRRLEAYALVERRAAEDSGPHAAYALTPLGRTLLEPIEALGRWSAEHGEAFAAAQKWDEEEPA
ncbi:winged helix-turn-helix transcriptional regulator [Streptomyces griseus]|uniref:winged helix-turn-helix transcriptional regulator n=1 Tax=Streptomyces griseus TaxID=1911 RepID=UPI002252C34F|nr:helix-turn-helix domain-containing protein [Streptomyces griseus]MCX4707789.1 helix-turn-helix transcriptional regulator [Streptomyces griseus]